MEEQHAEDFGRHVRLLWFGLLAAWLVLIAASVKQDFFGVLLGHRMQLLDVDYERSFYTWFSQLLLAAVAFTLFHIGAHTRSPSILVRVYWFLLAAAFLVLSMDEMLGFHERLDLAMRARMHTSGLLHFPWVAPALALCVIGLAASIPFLRNLPRAVVLMFLVSGGVFVLGAVGMEMIGARIVDLDEAAKYSTAYRIETNLEEGLEGLGALLFLGTLIFRRAQLVLPVAASVTLPWRLPTAKPPQKIAA